jgi:hypothetical protein
MIMTIIENYKINRLSNPDKLNIVYMKDPNNTYTVIKEYSILEYYFGFILNSLRANKDNKSYCINSIGNNIGKKTFLHYHINNSYGYPISYFNQTRIFDIFNIDDFIKIYMGLMMEYKLILIFNDYSEINDIIFTLVSFLYPLKWSFPIISYLTNNLVETLEAPFGIIIGAHVEYIPIIEAKLQQDAITEETLIYNLTNKTFLSFPAQFPVLPAKIVNEVRSNIYKFFSDKLAITSDMDNDDIEIIKIFDLDLAKQIDANIFLNLKLNQIFFNVFVELIKNLESAIYFNKVKSLLQSKRKYNL